MTRLQCRLARIALGWRAKDLAEYAGVGKSTVEQFEAGSKTPRRAMLAVMRQALEGAGIEFVGEKNIRVPENGNEQAAA